MMGKAINTDGCVPSMSNPTAGSALLRRVFAVPDDHKQNRADNGSPLLKAEN